MPAALADHRVVVDLPEDLAEPRARTLAHDHAGLEPKLCLRRLEHAGRRAKQLLLGIAGRDSHRGTDRREGDGARGDRAIGGLRIPNAHVDVREVDAKLIGADLREHGPRPGADVLGARGDDGGAIRVDVHRRVRGRPTAAAPDLRRHADPAAPVERGAAEAAGSPALPADLLRADAVALEKVLVRVALAAHRILR